MFVEKYLAVEYLKNIFKLCERQTEFLMYRNETSADEEKCKKFMFLFHYSNKHCIRVKGLVMKWKMPHKNWLCLTFDYAVGFSSNIADSKGTVPPARGGEINCYAWKCLGCT